MMLLNKLRLLPQRIYASFFELQHIRTIRASGFFDEAWYLATNPDVAQAKIDPLLHYLRYGGAEGRDPGPNFSSGLYLKEHEAVQKLGRNPLIHYLQHSSPDERKVRLASKNNPKLLQDKLDLIDYSFSTFKISSFADLGGIWGVEAGYTFYALERFNLVDSVLVDTHPTEIVNKRRQHYPQLRFVQGNFGSDKIVQAVGSVDAVFLFDVLLHQVDPSWDQILEMYAPQVRCLIIYNQQWIGSDSTVRLLDLGEEQYFNNVPHSRLEKPYNDLFQKLDQKHPDHDRLWRNVHHIWQWGITDIDLKTKAESLGFRLQFYKNYGQHGTLKNFEDHAFVFTK